jgi:hypothetical protein
MFLLRRCYGERPKEESCGLFTFGDDGADKVYNIELSIPPISYIWRTTDILSIVAVHGLGGHWARTWEDENGKLWLRDFLMSQLPNARIMSYGYNSKTAFSKAVTDINDEAAMLLDRLDGERRLPAEKTRPIIFISYSLGGIIVKKVGLSPQLLSGKISDMS